MNLQQKHHIQIECEALSIAYARYVDFSDYDEFTELFAEICILDLGKPLEGKAAIRAAMKQRSPKLRSRHVMTNIAINVIDEATATGISYLTLYRHVGEESLGKMPINFDAPAGVGHYTDEFTLTDKGWRISKREIEFAFMNPAKFSVPK